MGFIEAVKKAFEGTFTFSGRATRSEFWWFYLFTLVSNFVVLNFLLPGLQYGVSEILSLWFGFVYVIFISIMGWTLSVRRLHDVGRSGWWLLLVLTIIGIFWLLYWWVRPSGPDNKYGSPC